MRWWRDALWASLAAFGALVLAGLGAMVVAWRAAERTDIVGAQVPPLVSGGLGGLGLVVLGAGFAVVQVGRQSAANDRADMERLIEEAVAVADALRSRGEG